jgi:hypothetical protein
MSEKNRDELELCGFFFEGFEMWTNLERQGDLLKRFGSLY